MAIPRKMIGLGTRLYMKQSTGSTSTYTAIGGLLSLPGPNASADDIDTSTIENSTVANTYWKTFSRGQVDPGEMNVSLAYGTTDTFNKSLGTYFRTGESLTFKVTFPSTAVTAESFTGYIKGMGRELEKDSMITRNLTLKVSGSPGFKTT